MLIVSYAVSNILWGHYFKFYALFLMSQNAHLHMKSKGHGGGQEKDIMVIYKTQLHS
jgi:hypothetical protein